MPIDDFSSAAMDYLKAQVKRDIEKEFRLPEGACDRVNNDLLRILIWRDTRSDPGPLTKIQRQAYSAQYFNTIYHKKIAQGELLFKSIKEAEHYLLDRDFTLLRGKSVFHRDDLTATVMQSGLIVRIVVKNNITGATLSGKEF